MADEIPAPHRPPVLTIPQLFRASFQKDRCLLGYQCRSAAALRPLFSCKAQSAVPGKLMPLQTDGDLAPCPPPDTPR
jgi:hypothetical protein